MSFDAPDPPDYSEIAEASEYAADLSFDIAQEQLAWAQEQYAASMEVTEPIIDEFMQTLEFTNAVAEADRARYEELYQPLEEQLIEEAESYASPERVAQEMARAQADVAEQYNASREAAQMELESYGLNPADTRYAALDIETRTGQAAASAAAGEQAYQQAQAKADALRSEALNIGKGYPAQIQSSYNTALAAGAQSIAGQNQTVATGSNTMTQPSAYMSTGTQALDVWGNTINAGYQNELAAYNAEMSAMAGLGSMVGSVVGMIPFKEGGEVPRYPYQVGGPVPQSQSPSRGAQYDDVPASLTAGEFVMPEDVVRWKGSEHFYKEIQKAREGRQEAMTGAVPAGQRPGQPVGGRPAAAPMRMASQPARRPTAPMRPGVPPIAPGVPPAAARVGRGALPVGGRGVGAPGAGGAPGGRGLRMQAGGAPEDYYYYLDPYLQPELSPPQPTTSDIDPAAYRRAPDQAPASTNGGFAGGFAAGLEAARAQSGRTAQPQTAQPQPQPGRLRDLIAPLPRGPGVGAVAPMTAPGQSVTLPARATMNAAVDPRTASATYPYGTPTAEGVDPRAATRGVRDLRGGRYEDPRWLARNRGLRETATAYTPPGTAQEAYGYVPAVMGAPPPPVDQPRPLSRMGAPPPPFSATDYTGYTGGGPTSGPPIRTPTAGQARAEQMAEQARPSTTYGTSGGTSGGARVPQGRPSRTPRARPERESGSREEKGSKPKRRVNRDEMRSRGDVLLPVSPRANKPGQITNEPYPGTLSAEGFARQAQEYLRRKRQAQ